MKATQEAIKLMNEQNAEIEKLRTINDELVEALKEVKIKLCSLCATYPQYQGWAECKADNRTCKAVINAEQALAKAKGE